MALYPASATGSGPAIEASVSAASETVRTIGPAMSCEAEMGAMP